MKRVVPGVAVLIGALLLSGPAAAHGGGWRGPGPVIGAVVAGAVLGAAVSGAGDRTVYVEHQPAYYPPEPVYVQAPPPVYYAPPGYVVERYDPVLPPIYRGYYGPPRGYYGPPHGYYGPPRGYYGPPRGYYGAPRW